MLLKINGVEQTLDVTTLGEVLKALDVQQKYVAIALNGACIPKVAFASTTLRERDEIEILVPMQGG